MKKFRFGVADGLSFKTLDSCVQREVFVLYLLGVALADHMLVLGDEHRVAGPVVRLVGSDVEGFKVRHQPPASLVLPPHDHD